MSTATPFKRTIRFQVASDLHLEHDGSYDTLNVEKLPGVEWLLLPGDTGSAIRQIDNNSKSQSHSERYFNFLVRMCQKFQRVIMVIGNNDFKGPLNPKIHHPLDDGVAAGWNVVRSWPDAPAMNKRLVILNSGPDGRHDFMDDGYNVSILGCTLWSNRRKDQPQTAMFDRSIVGNSSAKNNGRHRRDLMWLKSEIRNIRENEKDADRVIIVMTHHAPCITGTSTPDKDGQGDSWSDFQVDILGGEGMVGLQADDIWVFGHTHWSTDFMQDEVRVYSNQRGGITKSTTQKGRPKRPEWYDEKRILEIECSAPGGGGWKTPY
ncbi:hypothetical protein N431DRAFT_354548 [Stipitochalara longipes BDJ]|nr:hypothetical protein N431DRAFT_354548 [Stipitochalara longipes BDJ]